LPELFVGQAKKFGIGLSQKEQVALLDQFRDGLFNVLIATSVAEEGLDIPSVDEVIFYEPIPSAIRSIQRRGRTGRQEKGKAILLITNGTRDEGYHWSAKGKEKKMQKTLKAMKDLTPKQPTLKSYEKLDLLIYADYREKGSKVVKALLDAGANIRLQMLDTGDFVVSNNTVIEYKRADDFVASIIDGRLISQLRELRTATKPLIIVEGEDLYSQRNIHPNAIRGMLASITAGFGIPLLQTKNPQETAGMLLALAKREQDQQQGSYSPHAAKRISTLKDMQEYLVSSLPGIGLSTAKNLLTHFGSVRKLFDAEVKELQAVDGVGPKTAEQVRDILDKAYAAAK